MENILDPIRRKYELLEQEVQLSLSIISLQQKTLELVHMRNRVRKEIEMISTDGLSDE